LNSTIDLLEPIKASSDFPKLLEKLQHDWDEEQMNRHDFWKKHDETFKAEFINGIGVYESPFYGRHWMASSNITRYMLNHVYSNKLGKLAYEKVMCRFTRNDYEPDIVFWKNEVADNFLPKQSAFPPPNFIIEILSDSTKDKDRGVKFEDYSSHNVQEYWIVDPDNNTVEQYLQSAEGLTLHLKLNQGIIKSVAIEGFEMEVLEIFEEK
jgi:Uma2 family endonuclease